MNLEKDPVSVVSNKNKTKVKINKKRVGIALGVTFISIFGLYVNNAIKIKRTYENMKISFTSVKEIEYGTANYNPLDLVKNVKEGSIKKYTKNIDTSKVGEQELVFEVAKDDIVKTYKIKINIKDTIAPEIVLANEEVTITAGDDFDVKSNIASVNDVIDGDLPYNDGNSTEKAYYKIETNLDNNTAGEYVVNITATDQNGNESKKDYKVIVNPKKVVNKIQNTNVTTQNYYSGPASVDTSSVLSAAQSLLGTRYTSGGTNPSTGFDCSGFVSYVYGVTGTSIGRSSSSQLNNGAAVSENDLQPGDIIIWANNGSNSASHSSIYAGNNTIIHATSNKGVQQTNLSNWKSWGQHIIGIRRV